MWPLLVFAAPWATADDLAQNLALRSSSPPLDWYARAFLGYGVVSAGLRDPGPQAAALAAQVWADMRARPMIQPYRTGTVSVAGQLGSSSAAWLGHLALLAEGRWRLGPLPSEDATFSEALLDTLAEQVLARPHHLLPTYGTRVWPADNEVVWAALGLAIRRDPRPRWVEAEAAMAQTLLSLELQRLPPSELRGLQAQDVPRGCALAWTVALRALHRPSEARALYRRFRGAYWQQLGPVAGLREWPRGIDRPADSDSGPIVLGIGAAASAFGLGATQMVQALDDHRALARSAEWAGIRRQKRVLARAIHFWSQHARPWDETLPK